MAHVAWTIVTVFDERTLQAWVQGMDPMLEDRSPLWILLHATTEDNLRRVILASRRFVTT